MIKFNLYNVTDTETGLKVKVWYHVGTDIYGNKRAWIHEDGYTRNLFDIFNNARNETDSMTDYFEGTKASFYEGDKYFNEIVAISEKLNLKRAARRQNKVA